MGGGGGGGRGGFTTITIANCMHNISDLSDVAYCINRMPYPDAILVLKVYIFYIDNRTNNLVVFQIANPV